MPAAIIPIVGAVAVGVSYLGGVGKTKTSSPFVSNSTDAGDTEMIRQAITTHKIIYGQMRVSGPLVFIHSRPIDSSSNKLDMLHLVIVLAGHEIDSMGDVYFNNVVVGFDSNSAATDAPYLGSDGTVFANIYQHLGAADQVADPILMANSNGLWTTAHRLQGLAYIHAMLRWDATAYAGGLPDLSVVIKGRKVYDPRTEVTAWSNNPALCILDYLTADFGLNAPYTEIDMDSFIAAANICDETVATIDSTENRYTCNGVADLGDDPQTTLQNMLTSCAGSITCVGGRWRLRVGAWSPAVYSLEPRHARDAVTFRPYRSHKDLINAVIGAFTSPDNQWQQTDYPEVAVDAYIAADGGDYASTTLDLPFTISPTMAQRIARIALEQNRRQRALTFPANLAGFCVAAGDNVTIDLPRFGFSGLICTVGGWQMSDDLGVDLDLTEDDEDVYAFLPSDLQALNGTPAITILNNAGINPNPPNDINATATTTSITITWQQITDSDFLYVEVWESEVDTANPATDAALIIEIYGNSVTQTNLPGQDTRFYWLRTVDRYGNKSTFAGPVQATTTGDATIVLILD